MNPKGLLVVLIVGFFSSSVTAELYAGEAAASDWSKATQAKFDGSNSSKIAKLPDRSPSATEAMRLEKRVAHLERQVARLTWLLEGVTRGIDPSTDQDTLTFSDMNVQIVNGSGATFDEATGTGNLIIGYNELRDEDYAQVPCPSDLFTEWSCNRRTGSHMLIVGVQNNYSSVGGIVVGAGHETAGYHASVSGGYGNAAYGNFASISGGYVNKASGWGATVSGGGSNRASGWVASVSGGTRNEASESYASVSGGSENVSSARYASVSGGNFNTASGLAASVSGGQGNIAGGTSASVSGGRDNTASGDYGSVTSGVLNEATGHYASIGGGKYNIASGYFSSVNGGGYNTASGYAASVSGGNNRTAGAKNCIVGDDGADC